MTAAGCTFIEPCGKAKINDPHSIPRVRRFGLQHNIARSDIHVADSAIHVHVVQRLQRTVTVWYRSKEGQTSLQHAGTSPEATVSAVRTQAGSS